MIVGLIPLVFFIFFGVCATYPRYPFANWMEFMIIPMFIILTIIPIFGMILGFKDLKNENTESVSSEIGIISSFFSLLFLLPYYTIIISIWMILNFLNSLRPVVLG